MTESLGQADTALTLDALRAEGAQQVDPVHFHYLESLARRLTEVPDPVRQLLQRRLAQGLDAHHRRWQQAQQTLREQVGELEARHPARAAEWRRLADARNLPALRHWAARLSVTRTDTALADLTQRLQQAGPTASEAGFGDDDGSASELKSVRRFSESWSRLAAQTQVRRAVEQAPGNAGPLNSHMLVLRSLALMRDLSPDYLRRFLSQVETLQWLEQAGQKHVPAPARAARRSRAKK